MSGDTSVASREGLSLVSRTDTPHPSRTEPYTVMAGDTLEQIAMHVYGNPQRWAEILEANRDQIDRPKLLRVGAELRIPRL